MRRRQLRIWWPKQYSSTQASTSKILFGWFLSSSPVALDVVVAVAVDEVDVTKNVMDLKVILHDINKGMPVTLQDKAVFSILGQHAADLSLCTGPFIVQRGRDKYELSSNGISTSWDGVDVSIKYEGNSCRCHKIAESLKLCKEVNAGINNWIQLVSNSSTEHGRGKFWIPNVHHVHWNQEVVSQCDVHVILYDTPGYGTHHFSLRYMDFDVHLRVPPKKPNWVNKLHLKDPLVDQDLIILSINSTSIAASKCLWQFRLVKSNAQTSIVMMFCSLLWHIFAVFVAFVSTLFYVVVRSIHGFSSCTSKLWIHAAITNIFRTALTNIRITCSQILYWPIYLQESGVRSYSCVEYAEKAAICRHSMWSSLVFDILLGNLFGFALLFQAESVHTWVMSFGNDMNNLLRIGCVWLMGVPAGFKLNTELAAILGTVSLNMIQFWSTLWVFMGFILIHVIKGLAMLGMFFGFTVMAGSVIDMVVLATLHMSALHYSISLVYSLQIQSLAALWRLFRGQKWNPLRLRLDSYDYSVEQHIVGSLLFTPLLLLLPTTSVFYVFFTMMSTSVSFIYMFVEVVISLIHEAPYTKIFLWFIQPRRFPAGIWFRNFSCDCNRLNRTGDSCSGVHNMQSDFGSTSVANEEGIDEPSSRISTLQSNSASIGQIILPHYRKVFSGVPGSLVADYAYGILVGKRIGASLGAYLPPALPLTFMPCMEYWHLCHEAVLSCVANRRIFQSQ